MKDIKILLVDDDIDFVFIQKAFLEKEGFQVVTAGDKLAGFERAKAEKPDLAILDVMMTTDQEGFEMAREMRKDPLLKDIPIIMLTSVDSVTGLNLKEMANDPKWLPVDSYLEKPVQPQKLLSEIKRLLKL
ncbi:MAG TPA: response regulator [Bacteroidales bacterium]|jgi:DNA-binding response OmpR family regulator|nr:response regulator [Bacteroidales bacterium]HQN98514.1 response regulator [Bacteroidales bacterium]HQQ02562.1 response regulator [Bacteroidales bacterium]